MGSSYDCPEVEGAELPFEDEVARSNRVQCRRAFFMRANGISLKNALANAAARLRPAQEPANLIMRS